MLMMSLPPADCHRYIGGRLTPCLHWIVSHGEVRHSLAFSCEPDPEMVVEPSILYRRSHVDASRAKWPNGQLRGPINRDSMTHKAILQAKFSKRDNKRQQQQQQQVSVAVRQNPFGGIGGSLQPNQDHSAVGRPVERGATDKHFDSKDTSEGTSGLGY